MYKKYGIVILILFYLADFAPYSFCEENKANMELSLSLGDAITIAFKNNKDIQIQEKGIPFLIQWSHKPRQQLHGFWLCGRPMKGRPEFRVQKKDPKPEKS